MLESANRTFICSVLFLDIVEYSKRSVAEQIRLKEGFNTALSEAIAGVATDARIILDTGDGAAVSFLGDPEDSLFAAMTLRDAVASAPAPRVRLGVNLGPVRLVRDINGQPNIIGDGINVAQRIMSFAEPGQILVSRSYYEVIARLAEDYADLFHYEGSKTDKHVREHEVYAVGTPPKTFSARTPEKSAARPAGPGAMAVLSNLRPRKLAGAMHVNPKLLIVAPVAFVAIVGSGMIWRGYSGDEEVPATVAVPAAPGSAPKTEAVVKAKPAATEEAVRPAAREATVNISVLPWAEVYVDGRKQGVSPPLRSVPVAPGRHKVELRNTSFPAHVQTIEVKPGERVSVRYRFQ